MKTLTILIALSSLATVAFADDAPKGAPPPKGKPFELPAACKPLSEACLKAGFKPGGASEGLGVLVHCVMPLAMGPPKNPQNPAPKAAKEPPVVKKSLIDACKKGFEERRKPKKGKK